MSFFAPAGHYIAPYLAEISMAFIACFLVMLGGEINAILRRVMLNQHFIVRTLAFIALNAFGYGLLIVKASPYLARTLSHLERGMMFSLVIISFIVIGLWAQKNRQI
ncbi:DUF3392 family protein [Vibrio sp. V27_P1S3P104]|nr:DUF3392 family protein [Vibrio sp. V28_P6S34P95]NAX04862.1 DUF3392 family protein [Vibrio sp. V30_P3S12P165]NAX34336.1 DUF3392 family protein [Vibrio sp. V29_P1S30P107]NAX36461.1 DUF3392 family protein [Vibrio sp. V27_P1S3P104]NAX39223.1 DUF3392 family protein [Vibrio sp. V26_P1S5P106]NNN43891.1 DUF3392 domain-containing protein [Vibrio sp. 1-1(7)]NNN71715.1 DUF3392 domain-containing protein [Vibrio sp. 12-2(3-a)]